MPPNINALLAALKTKESGGGLPDDADPADTAAPAAPPEAEDSPEDTAEDNAKIVDALQTQYPQIFAKLSKQIESDDGSDTSDSGADMSDMGMMK